MFVITAFDFQMIYCKSGWLRMVCDERWRLRLVRNVAEQTPWPPSRCSGYEVRNTGIDVATSSYVSAMTVCANKSAFIDESKCQHQLKFIYVLCGSDALAIRNDRKTKQLQAATSTTSPILLDYKIEISYDDSQLFIVKIPTLNY